MSYEKPFNVDAKAAEVKDKELYKRFKEAEEKGGKVDLEKIRGEALEEARESLRVEKGK